MSMFATTNKSPSADETEPCHAHDHHYISKYQSFGIVAVIILVTMVLAVFDAEICKFCRASIDKFLVSTTSDMEICDFERFRFGGFKFDRHLDEDQQQDEERGHDRH